MGCLRNALLEIFGALTGVRLCLELIAPGSFISRNCLVQVVHGIADSVAAGHKNVRTVAANLADHYIILALGRHIVVINSDEAR